MVMHAHVVCAVQNLGGVHAVAVHVVFCISAGGGVHAVAVHAVHAAVQRHTPGHFLLGVALLLDSVRRRAPHGIYLLCFLFLEFETM